MGHIRLGRLPATKRWQQVVALLSGGAPVEQIAGASAEAAENSLEHARNDPAVQQSFWLLTQIPLAARAPDFPKSLQRLGLEVGASASLFDILGAFAAAVDRQSEKSGGRTDLGEMAQHAAAESLAAFAASDLPTLLGPTPSDVRLAIGKLAAPDRFARVGPGRRLRSTDDHVAFGAALEQHCREASRIVEAFAGGWFSKAQFEGTLTPEKAGSFIFIALGKIARELRKRRAPGA